MTNLLDDELIALLETVAALARKGGTAGMSAGSRKGVLRGGNEEFADYRPYQQGDDLRRIDWKPYLRLDELVVKVFARSTAGNVHILLDSSSSMAIPESKALFTRRICAALGYLALCSSDRLTIWHLRHGSAVKTGPMEGKRSVHRMIELLSDAAFEGATDLRGGFLASIAQIPARPEAVVVSDLWDNTDPFSLLAPIVARGASLSFVQVMALEEYSPSPMGLVRLEDSESGDFVTGWVGHEAVEKFRKLFADRVGETRRNLTALRIPYFPARSDEDIRNLVIRLARG